MKVQIDVPPDAMGHNATLCLKRHVRVKDSRPVDQTQDMFQHDFRIEQRTTTCTIPASSFSGFSYDGTKIDDSFFFDTKVSEEILGTLKKTAKVNKKTKALIDPSDHFDVFTNLDAIPVENRTVTMALLVVGLVVIAVNTLIGLHDQAVPEMQTFLYSDGDSSSPLFKSLVASGSIWLMIKKQLRKYMKFDLKGSMGQIDRTSSIPIQQLIFGHSRVELNNATLRVVACNLEKGQYVRGSGSK